MASVWALCQMWRSSFRRERSWPWWYQAPAAFWPVWAERRFCHSLNCIRRIGSDIILVELEPDKCRVPPSKTQVVLDPAGAHASSKSRSALDPPWDMGDVGYGLTPPKTALHEFHLPGIVKKVENSEKTLAIGISICYNVLAWRKTP